jgi:hypothetical protein
MEGFAPRPGNFGPTLKGALPPIVLCLGLWASACPATEPPKDQPSPGTTVLLPPLTVAGKPVGSFGFSVCVLRSEVTQRALLITVKDVQPDSEAKRKGLSPGTEILSIDGTDVHAFKATFARGSDLNSKLLDRARGDRITLEILPIGEAKPRLITLVEGRTPESDADGLPPNGRRVYIGGNRGN